ncbi:MAG: HEAT repeat domain-containing protein [Myxococcota bacterium]
MNVLPLSLDVVPFARRYVLPAQSDPGKTLDSARARGFPRTGPRFERHCLEEFEYLAQTTPQELLYLMDTELRVDPVLLAQAAGSLALSTEAQAEVAAMLLRLLRHSRPFVREEALRGLSPFVRGNARLEASIRHLTANETSEGVRQTALEVLEQSA